MTRLTYSSVCMYIIGEKAAEYIYTVTNERIISIYHRLFSSYPSNKPYHPSPSPLPPQKTLPTISKHSSSPFSFSFSFSFSSPFPILTPAHKGSSKEKKDNISQNNNTIAQSSQANPSFLPSLKTDTYSLARSAVCLSVCLTVCVFNCLSVCLSICLSVCLFVCLSVCLSVCLYVCMSICLSIY